MSEAVRLQDPAETLDYTLDWSSWIPSGDSILSSNWAISPSGPTLSNDIIGSATTTCFVSGMTFAVIYTLTNTILTLQERTASRSITIRCDIQ
jgi:hypothetical protein